jgi:predicted nucleotidyltransferase
MNSPATVITSVLTREPAVIAGYIFGSVAKGRAHAESDIDVAVLLKEDVPFSQLEVMTLLEKKLELRVDLIVVNRATELLKHEIRKTGQLIFDRDSVRRKQFDIRSRKYFEDFLYLHKRYVNKVLYTNNHD